MDPFGAFARSPLLSVARRIHFLWWAYSRSLSFSHVLALRSLRPRFASLADGAADHPHPLYRQFNWDQIRRKRTAAASTRRERPTVVLPRPKDDLFPLCPRARTNAHYEDERQRGMLPCLCSLGFVLARLFLRSSSGASYAWDSRIDQGIRKTTLISSDRSRLEVRRTREADWDAVCMYVCMYEVSSARRASWEISRDETRG